MQDKQIQKLVRAAEQRLTSAGILLSHQMYLDAMYIAGYAPECAMKAVILSHVPRTKRQPFQIEWFRGSQAHNYEHLKAIMKTVGAGMPSEIARQLRRVNTWSTDLRYETGKRTGAEAEEFVNAAKHIVDWAKRSLA